MSGRAVFDPVDIVVVVDGIRAAIKFSQVWMQVDPRSDDQHVTTCYLRPLEGPRELAVGVTVCSPAENYRINLYGKKLALARAIKNFMPYLSERACWRMARLIIWNWLKQQADLEALNAALQEMQRLNLTSDIAELADCAVSENPGG